MEQLLAIVAITAATFVATSFDNLVLLVAFLGDTRYRWRSVVVGYVTCSMLIAAIAAKGVLSVGAVMLASSGDTFASLFALFTDTADPYTIPMLATVAAAALAWCGLAAWLFSRPPLERILSRTARYVLPFLLIGIGVYILLDSGTDLMVG